MEEHSEKDDRISIQVVFQGGGAKLVGLLAAAKVIFDQKDKLNLRISRISGTSAGALAGCILATGKDPELFRKDILRLAPSYMPTIRKSVGLHRALAIVNGKPLYDSKNYRKFLKELFEASAGVTHLRQLPTPVLFHATNIKNGVPMDFDGSRNEDTVEEVLFRSSALPFIFETFKGQPYVDGGLISNFPAYNLGASPGFENDQIIGFSFPATGDYPFDKGFFSYSKSLMFTAMDVSIARARYELPPQNVCEIQTDLTTLDFDKAFEQLRSNVEFDNYKRKIIDFLEKFAAKERTARKLARRTKGLEDETTRAIESEKLKHEREIEDIQSLIRAYHDQVCSASPFKVLKKTVINTCNALKSGNKKTLDYLAITDIFTPTHKTVTGYGSVVMFARKSADVSEVRPSVVRLTNGVVDASSTHSITSINLPIAPIGDINYSNVMFFFHPPLEEARDTTFELSFSCQHAAMFEDLIDGKGFATYIYGAKTKDIDHLDRLPVSRKDGYYAC